MTDRLEILQKYTRFSDGDRSSMNWRAYPIVIWPIMFLGVFITVCFED